MACKIGKQGVGRTGNIQTDKARVVRLSLLRPVTQSRFGANKDLSLAIQRSRVVPNDERGALELDVNIEAKLGDVSHTVAFDNPPLYPLHLAGRHGITRLETWMQATQHHPAVRCGPELWLFKSGSALRGWLRRPRSVNSR